MAPQSIKKIRKKHQNEWLLIRVLKMDKATTTPLSGKLIAHSPDRDLIFRKSVSLKGRILVDYASDKLPKGHAVAF